jgi:hypothetical protein
MTLDIAIAAAERTEAARNLIGQAQADVVDLVTVSALDLCVLGGPRHPIFEEVVTQAWTRLGSRQRKKVTDQVIEVLVNRGLLTDDNPGAGFPQPGGTYSLRPELGIMLAARCRPTFIVIASADDRNPRALRLFALGDQAEPVRGIVAEFPAALSPDQAGTFPNAGKLGPLGWIYRYVLVSQAKAAEILAKWTISPPMRSGAAAPPGWVVSAYHPDGKNPVGNRLRVRGDGTKASLDSPDVGNGGVTSAEYDAEGLRAVMLGLLTGPSR